MDPLISSPVRQRDRRFDAKTDQLRSAILTVSGSNNLIHRTSVLRGPYGTRKSVFEVLAAWRAAGVARQEAKDKDADEEEDDRVNGDLEGEHGDRPASV